MPDRTRKENAMQSKIEAVKQTIVARAALLAVASVGTLASVVAGGGIILD
jgi:hypothetical protein